MGLAVVAVGAIVPPQDLKVSRLTVVDGEGRARMVLGMKSDELFECAALGMRHPDGKSLLEIKAYEDGSAEVSFDNAKNTRRDIPPFMMGLGNDGVPHFVMLDPRNKSEIWFGNARPGLKAKVLDPNGKDVFHAP